MEVIPQLELLIWITVLLKNVENPLSNQGIASKNYVDTNAFTTTGGVVPGDIN